MEFINNFGPIGKFMYKSNVASFRYLGYYFNEQLSETNLDENTYLMVNDNNQIPENITCLFINFEISFERLNQIICDTDVKSIVFFKNMTVANIDTNTTCKNIKTLVCYKTISMNMINKFFPDVQSLYLIRQKDSLENANIKTKLVYDFKHLQELYILLSDSFFQLNAENLEQLSIYSSTDGWFFDLKNFPKLHTLRIDENIKLMNLDSRKELKVLQYYPSVRNNNAEKENNVNLRDLNIADLILPPNKKYTFKSKSIASILGTYVNDYDFFNNVMTIDATSIQIYDNIYPLKMCSQRFTNIFYKYFPYPDTITTELIECFDIQKQRENLIMIFNFDFMDKFDNNDHWQKWYNICIETYHRIPIIIQNAQLMLTNGEHEANEKVWPNIIKNVRKECIIFLPEKELIYINCSPLRLQTLVDKIKKYRQQKFIINKLWLVTNGFEINTKDIEDRVENLVIVHNEVKMYITF